MSETGDSGTSEREILLAIRDHFAPAVGTTDIAETVGVTRQAVYQRLNKMEEKGLVEAMNVGRSRIWWPTTDGLKLISDEN